MNEIPRTACAGRSEQTHKPHNAESHPPTPLASFRAKRKLPSAAPFPFPQTVLEDSGWALPGGHTQAAGSPVFPWVWGRPLQSWR